GLDRGGPGPEDLGEVRLEPRVRAAEGFVHLLEEHRVAGGGGGLGEGVEALPAHVPGRVVVPDAAEEIEPAVDLGGAVGADVELVDEGGEDVGVLLDGDPVVAGLGEGGPGAARIE